MRAPIVAYVSAAAAFLGMAGCNGEAPPPAPQEKPATPVAATPAPPAFPAGDSNFETWALVGAPIVHDKAVAAPDGTTTADAVDVKINEGLQFVTNKPVAAGDTRTTKIYLWGEPGKLVALQIVDGCSPKAVEIETVNVELTNQPQEFSISRKFTEPHTCTFFQFISQSPGATVINAWNARNE